MFCSLVAFIVICGLKVGAQSFVTVYNYDVNQPQPYQHADALLEKTQPHSVIQQLLRKMYLMRNNQRDESISTFPYLMRNVLQRADQNLPSTNFFRVFFQNSRANINKLRNNIQRVRHDDSFISKFIMDDEYGSPPGIKLDDPMELESYHQEPGSELNNEAIEELPGPKLVLQDVKKSFIQRQPVLILPVIINMVRGSSKLGDAEYGSVEAPFKPFVEVPSRETTSSSELDTILAAIESGKLPNAFKAHVPEEPVTAEEIHNLPGSLEVDAFQIEIPKNTSKVQDSSMIISGTLSNLLSEETTQGPQARIVLASGKQTTNPAGSAKLDLATELNGILALEGKTTYLGDSSEVAADEKNNAQISLGEESAEQLDLVTAVNKSDSAASEVSGNVTLAPLAVITNYSANTPTEATAAAAPN